MTPEIGQFALLLALAAALAQAVLPLWGAQARRERWLALAQPLAGVGFGLVTVAFATLVASFVRMDTSVAYVASNASRALPLGYRITASWGGHEGSLLLWVWMLSAWGALVAARGGGLPVVFAARVQGVLGLVAAGFLGFIAFTSNPFDRLLPAPPDGRDLNPLLQDPGMAAHPPLLYLGYVGFAVGFAFAVAALLEDNLDARWTRWARPWVLAAWSALTAGILLGSFWAYYELGWGGFWFWDAVENAAFMPWLLGTALIHSLAVAEKRPGFLRWSLLLALLCFSLSLLGTFLVRSGVVTSVHAFASDPARGLFILALLGLSVGGSLALFAWRGHRAPSAEGYALGSRESLLLLNNLLLATATGTVLLGTLYPLAAEVVSGTRLSVGAPYFDTVFPPITLPLAALLAVGPLARWRVAGLQRLRPLWPLAAGALGAAAVLALSLQGTLWLAAGVATGLWALGGTLALAWRQRAAWRDSLPLWLAHAGIGVFVLGVTLVRSLEQAHDVSLAPGEQVAVAGHVLRFDRLEAVQGANYRAARARLSWQRNGEALALAPEKRIYAQREMAMTEAAISRSLWCDVYVSLGEAGSDGRWSLRLQVKPFMTWVWIGALAMAAGGLWGALARRRRQPVPEADTEVATRPAPATSLAPTLSAP
ncbi:heme lyase CcmF/NrfE family subunit [Roseateles cellulosilyticus]|uniref:Heme lyase CcmF/NrfE family subunit n=1 Tax=Pelomonas cellulosilytica TaxID=2906762 RepID=A0ABS8XSU4_9BURK|nr:heme lyase CcmF/NrfE family subunit [Pelomonas sp. P8]MCE4553962.1 heme lyase CcmF/NrfE family subunit [Pelomonas sp. P8]